MNFENPNGSDGKSGEQSGEQSQKPMQGAEPASKRDAYEAEKKAGEAMQFAEDLHEELQEEVTDLRFAVEELRAEVEELRSLSAAHAVSLEYLFENAGRPGFSSLKRDYVVPAQLSEEVAAMKGDGDGSE